VFYGSLGAAPARPGFVAAMVLAMTVNAALAAVAALTALLLPCHPATRRRGAGRRVWR
jgi:hypothetical protein